MNRLSPLDNSGAKTLLLLLSRYIWGQSAFMSKLVSLLLKKLVFFTLITVLFISSNLIHKVIATDGINNQINFQGKLVNPTTGVNVADNTYSVIFTLYDADYNNSPNQLWTETQSVTTVDGTFRVSLGSVNSLSSVDFSKNSIWLGIKVGADSEMHPYIRFTAAPYAFNSQKVNGLTVTNTSDNPFSSATTLKMTDGKTVIFNDSTGANSLTVTTTGATTVTLPTSGVLFSDTNSINFADAATGIAYTIAGSDATSGTNAGGDLTIRAGNGSTSGTGGALILAGGTSSGTDGAINLQTDGTTRWTINNNGILQSNGAQTIQTSTGNLTLATAAGNGNIFLMPNGSGNVGVGTTTTTAKFETYVNTSKVAAKINTNQSTTPALQLVNTGDTGTIDFFTANEAGAVKLTIDPNTEFQIAHAGNDFLWLPVASNGTSNDAFISLLDSAGSSSFKVRDSGASSVFSVDSTGNILATGTTGITLTGSTGSYNSALTAGSTGTTANLLVKLNTSGQAITTDTSTLNNAIGVALETKSSGQAVKVAASGVVTVVADNTVTAGDFIGVGTSTAGRAKSLGTSFPSSNGIQVVGRAISGASAGSTFTMVLGSLDNNVNTSVGGGISTVQEGGSDVTTSATTLNLTANDFAVSGATGTSTVGIDYTNSHITRDNQTQTISGAWTFNTVATTFTTAINANGGITTTTTDQALNFSANGAGDFVFTADNDTNLQLTGTLTGTSAQDLGVITLTNQTTSGTQRGLVITQANDVSQTETTEQLLHILNSDLTSTVTDGLKIEENATGSTITNGLNITNTAGTITNGISITNSANTMAAALLISNTGTLTNSISAPNFTVAGTGALTAVGVNSGSGQIAGTGGLSLTGTVGLNTSGSGGTTIGNASSTTTINIGSDATGDLLYRSSGGGLTRLTVGSATQVIIGGTTPSYLTAPSSGSQCLQSDSGNTALTWATCSPFTDNGSIIYPNSTQAGYDFMIGGQTAAAAEFYFDLDNGSSQSMLYIGRNNTGSGGFDGGLTFYSSGNGVADPVIYADSSGNLNLSAPAGTVNVGSGTGDITLTLSNVNDEFTGTKSLPSLAANYTNTNPDYSFQRNFIGNFTQGGTVFSITDVSQSNTTMNPTMLLVNAAPASGTYTGNLMSLQVAGTDHFTVSGNSTADKVRIYNNSGTSTTGVDGLQVDYATTGTTASTDNAGIRVNTTSNNNGGTTTLEGIYIGDLTSAETNSTETALKIGANWDVGVSIASGGLSISGGSFSLSSGSRPGRKVTLSPEYPGAVLTGSGSGAMTSDFCAASAGAGGLPATNTTICNTSGDVHNYYSWVATSGTTTYSIWVRWRVPDNWAAWDTNPVQVNAKRVDGTNGSIKVYVYDTASALNNAGGTETAGAANTWVQNPVALSGGTWTPGSYMTIRIDMTATSTSASQVGEININYLSNN